MQSFISRIFFFLLPLLVISIIFELLLRTIPNDYSYKQQYLVNHAKEIEVLILGSSHAYRAFNPDRLDFDAFNAAYVSQTLDYDYKIYEAFTDDLSNLKCLIIPISYFTLHSRLVENKEKWRTKNYAIYYGMFSSNFTDYSEVLSNKVEISITRLKNYFIDRQSQITCSLRGWGKFENQRSESFEMLAEAAIERHTIQDDKWLKPNLELLNSLIALASARDIKFYLFRYQRHKNIIL